MTVTNTTVRIAYNGNGATTAFAIPFGFYASTDVEVLLNGVVQSSGYTITGAGGASGTCTFTTAPASGTGNVVFILNPPITQTANFVDGTQFPSATVNQALDRGTQVSLRLQDQVSRALRAPDQDTSPSMLLPAAANRANTYLTFDSNGNASVAIGVSSTTLTASAIGSLITPPTAAENNAGVTVVQGWYVPGVIDRYGINTTPGTTDLTTAVAAACAQAMQPGGAPVQGASTYLTTGSIANLHAAPKTPCEAIIKRGSTSFYLFPTASQTNTLNVTTTGNDSNDGLGTSQAFLTLQAAVNALSNYGPMLGGSWVIQMGAGSFAGATMPSGLDSLNWVQIKGAAGVLPFTPTTIIGNASNGIVLNGFNNRVLAQDLYFQNCTNSGNGFGIVGQDFSDLYLTHCFFSNCDNAIKIQQGRVYIGQACYVTGGVVGLTCISQVTLTAGYGCSVTATGANYGGANVGLYITGCSQAGVLMQEHATGHFDYCGVNNSAVGADLVVCSRLNCNFTAFTNNATAALRLREGSNWNDNGTTALMSGNGTDVVLYGGCGEFGRQGGWTIGRRQPVDATFITNTGTIGATTVKTYANAVDALGFNSQVKNFRVRIVGTMAGTVGTKNVTVNLDGSAIAGFTTAAVAGDFCMDVECYAYGTNQQSYVATFAQNGQTTLTSQGSRSITPTNGTITIQETINGAGDTVSIRTVTIWNEGGA